MVDCISIYGGSGYGMSYSFGDAIYAFGVFLALSMLIAGYVLQCQRDGISVYDQPRIFIALGGLGVLYALLWPVGFLFLVSIIILSQHFGHHGQWIGIAIINFAAWICFIRCLVPRSIR